MHGAPIMCSAALCVVTMSELHIKAKVGLRAALVRRSSAAHMVRQNAGKWLKEGVRAIGPDLIAGDER